MGSCAFSKFKICNDECPKKLDLVDQFSSSICIQSPQTYTALTEPAVIHHMPEIDPTQTSQNKKLNSIINEILPSVRSVIMKNNEESYYGFSKLQQISKKEQLCIPIIIRLINRIEINDPLGPSIISIFLAETPLPSKEQIELFTDQVMLDNRLYSAKIQKNIFVILSCLSEKVVGSPVAKFIFEKSFGFLMGCLKYGERLDELDQLTDKDLNDLQVLLYALIALDKSSLSSQNQLSVKKYLTETNNPLILLAKWHKSANTNMHQIGFLAQNLLDNVFTPSDHVYHYLTIKTYNVNAILNDEDTSENLKISSDGLEARNDSLAFESVRSTCMVVSGCWFYEATLLTNGISQIGFATKDAKFQNHLGCGIGDDQFSVGYDGCRNFIWHNGNKHQVNQRKWLEGDVVGCLLDIEKKMICFYLNGVQLKYIHTAIFQKSRTRFCPAASFMSFQHVVFNFGNQPFKYPPKIEFRDFNSSYVKLAADKRCILPRRVKIQMLREIKVTDDDCSICYTKKSNVKLLPCKHQGFCENCVLRMDTLCPICRCKFTKAIIEKVS